jgi:HD superfamily phosphodiesterase
VFKLIKVKDKLFTNTAKKMAKKKHEIMVKFFDSLNNEIWGIKKLFNK